MIITYSYFDDYKIIGLNDQLSYNCKVQQVIPTHIRGSVSFSKKGSDISFSKKGSNISFSKKGSNISFT